ncbi:KxYKxGKxW signal peptide domain-containing protein [Secundilactobacillus silagei]|uniref:Gram-positive cocci surface proteins LPxTG domain-containing protein n=1 Tax=Secundilactobacillus silagei JCM 19001 TaxID=1302250 RepID=A0A1Z5IIM4_9LACO|nr:KxYKxGKxW signal peptide domain-containing protein [Secundilactobacillus silagei]TDG67348.1 hypothetical protein C5L25_000944 [Secundilactobacillus silagei JCM 19001]GAX01291.1 hypothetical protein IWT126_01317 [Secundilactobacillus silagei JCM 19001]
MSRNNLVSPFIENKHTVRLYKQGKRWVTIGITMATLAGISLATGTTAKAADNAAGDAAPETSQSAANTPSNTATLRTPAKPAANAVNGATGSANANTTNASPTTNSANSKQNAAAAANPKVAPTPAPAPAPVQTPQATATNTIVKTTDAKGNASTDPTKTETNNPVQVSGQEVADKFTTGGSKRIDPMGDDTIGIISNSNSNSNGLVSPEITGDTVQLTNPKNEKYVEDGAVVANDAVDFKTDFNLNATVNVNWDPSMGWLGGDGMAVSFQPLDLNTAILKAKQGSYMGLVPNTKGTISYIVSSNAIGLSPATVDGKPYNRNSHWVIYQSGSNSTDAIGNVYDTKISTPQGGSTGSITYTFNVNYITDKPNDPNNNKVVTEILDSNNNIVQKYTKAVGPDQIGHNYVLGVTAASADSKAAYIVKINKYGYVPADAKLNITSNLPTNAPSVQQSGILGTPGQVIAFYKAGTQAPTTDANGKAVSVAYAVPTVPDYTLAGSQFITLTAGGVNNIELNYAKVQTVTATVTIPSNLGNQTVSKVTGVVNTIINVPVPTISGYTKDKTTVPATVNDDNTITVNTPKAKTGDAGYVTYTKIKTTDDNNQPGGSTTETTQTDTTTPPTTTPTTTDSDNDITTPTTATDSSNDTAAPTATKKSKNSQVTPSISTDSSKGTVVPEAQSATQSGSQSTTEQHAATVASSVTGQAKVTKLSNSVTAPSQSATGQKGTAQNASGQLPQTNEQSDQTKTTGFLGLIMLSLLSFFGLRRKQTGDK